MNKQKIGIIAANNIRYSPYIQFYRNILDDIGMDYELIYPDRNGIADSWDGVAHKLKWNNHFPSLINYALYAIQYHRIVKEKGYTKVILLTSINAVYSSIWMQHVKSCIVDIRDYTYESNRVYFRLEKFAFKAAQLKVISSERFRLFLPKGDYLVCHNISMSGHRDDKLWGRKKGRIIIGYIGSVAYYTNVQKLIKLVQADERFCFYIYGGGPEEKRIDNLVKEIDCDRIKYFGRYKPEEKRNIIYSVDILFNCYGNHSLLVNTALSNKLYDGMFYRKLILNSPGTYMEEMCGPCGFSLDLEQEMSLDKLYLWYENLNEEAINVYQDKMLRRFKEENDKTIEALKSYFLN